MENGDFGGDEFQKHIPFRIAAAEGVLDQFGIGREPGIDPDQNGCAHGAEGNRCALDYHPGDYRSHGRESEPDHQRHRDRGWSTKSRGTLDKGAEQPGNNDDLNPAVRGDIGKALTNSQNGTALL